MSKFIKILLLSLVFFSLASIYYADSNYDKERLPEINSDVLQNLLEQRNMIMNEGIYNCSNIDLVIEKLKSVEKGHILESDIISLEAIYNSPTDFPKVNDVSVKDFSRIEFSDDSYELICDIQWNISYYLEDITEEYRYFIKVKVVDNEYFLEDMKLYE